MKRLKITGCITFGLLMLFGMLCIRILSRPMEEKVDIVMLNSMMQTAADNWEQLDKLEEKEFPVAYVIFDKEDHIVYQSTDEIVPSIEMAIKNKLSYMNIVKEGKWLGEVVLLQQNTRKAHEVDRLKELAFSMVASMGLVLGVYFVYIYRRILVPFNKLQDFAKEVARGNLEMPLAMEKENFFGAFTESFDILREELKEARRSEYEVKQREKELIATLSHDIKTPVTGIKLISEVLEIQIEDPALKEKVNAIYHKADQINVLVTDLFSATLEELSELKVELREEYAYKLEEIVRKMDYEGKITQDEIPECMLYIDINRIEQVISNVISNSYKYAGTKINVTYKLITGYLQMEIRDFGEGILPDEVHLVFNKFYRGKKGGVSERSGAGLGLFISKSLIEKMGGEISCYNLEDGFAVKLLLPFSCTALCE